MGFRTTFLSVLMSLSFITPVHANAKFDEYATGAMQVYKQFKTYDKQESEQFFSFLKTKWETNKCSNSCAVDGYNAAKAYAVNRKVELENEIR